MPTIHEQLLDEVKGMGAAWHEKFATLQKQIDEVQKKAQRVGYGVPDESAIESKAFARFLRSGDDRELREIQVKGMDSVSGPDGGYTCPPSLSREIQRVAMLYSPMRSLARVVKADRANYAAIVSLDAAGAEWLGETDTRNDTATPALAEVKPPSGELSSVAPVTRWLLEDSEYNIEAFLTESIGKQHGITEGAAFLNGDGVNKPKGILTHTFVTTADGARTFGQLQKLLSGTAGSFDADDLIELLYALKPEYRAKAAFVMNPTTLAAVRKLKDSNGRFIWEPSSQAGQPATLFGRPVHEDSNMPVMAADALAVLCGDFDAGYHILDVGRQVLIRDEITRKGWCKLYVAKRVGGTVVDSNSIKALQLSAIV
jgi:HK97 family phage major capsid protein